jgi:cytochrome c553
MKRTLATAGALAGLALGAAVFSVARDDGFPHERHAGLFPTCVGCHAGVEAGDSSRMVSITPEECANCHDGVELQAVAWDGPSREPSNLAFPHPLHSEMGIACADCHQIPGEEVTMAVGRAAAETCLACHAPEAPEHYAYDQVRCSTCHLPLARAIALPVSRIAEFPRPQSHAEADFLLTHGGVASSDASACAVCHARQSCERCHLDAEGVPAIAGLAPDERVATLVAGRPGEWPEPASHQQEDWVQTHQEEARRDVTACATCHTRDSCATCHGEGRPTVAARLAVARPGGPEGVRITAGAVMPVGHTPTFFDRHGTAAAIGVPQCSACHAEKECIACHDGVQKPSFHPLDFVVRHGAEAFAEQTECAACHSEEAFCRDCHTGLGFAAGGRTGAAFHDAQPDWLLAHGQAARQDLESCVACHSERTCLRCHSAKTGFRVSPHGPDFDPDHVADKSTQSCAICHLTLPGAGP